MPRGFRIVAAARVERDLARLPEKVATACIEFVNHQLAAAPLRLGKPLRGEFAGAHSARRGVYRIVYRVNHDARTVEIVRIDHRGDVYRR